MRIPIKETLFVTRGFKSSSMERQTYLESIGETFVFGYHAALDISGPEALASYLDETIPIEKRGFAFEGAAMSLALTDFMTLRRQGRLKCFIEGAGNAHLYMVYIGAGWALARFPLLYSWFMKAADPLLKWLAVEGMGFHQAYFYTHKTLRDQKIPRQLAGYAQHAFYQGVGRCLWFVHGGDVDHMKDSIQPLPQTYHADLWSGVGLAAAYAGGVEPDALKQLSQDAGIYHADLAQGVAFAAKARCRAQNMAPHTEMAAQLIGNCSAREAADYTDTALEHIVSSPTQPAYAAWRKQIKSLMMMQEPLLTHQ